MKPSLRGAIRAGLCVAMLATLSGWPAAVEAGSRRITFLVTDLDLMNSQPQKFEFTPPLGAMVDVAVYGSRYCNCVWSDCCHPGGASGDRFKADCRTTYRLWYRDYYYGCGGGWCTADEIRTRALSGNVYCDIAAVPVKTSNGSVTFSLWPPYSIVVSFDDPSTGGPGSDKSPPVITIDTQGLLQGAVHTAKVTLRGTVKSRTPVDSVEVSSDVFPALRAADKGVPSTIREAGRSLYLYNWVYPDFPLEVGPNAITATAVNSAGTSSSAGLSVARDEKPPTDGGTNEPPGGTGPLDPPPCVCPPQVDPETGASLSATDIPIGKTDE